MQITINNHQYEANAGDRLLDIARRNHEHIGYFCGGNALCQTCYVKVLEGSDLLSPLNEEEIALLSSNLVKEGTRIACQATIEKPGTIKFVSAVEEVKQMFDNEPLQLVGYAGKMGWEALVKLPETLQWQAKRELDLWEVISDVLSGIGDALILIGRACQPSCYCKTGSCDCESGKG
jgi:chlorosome envelope protein X